LSDTLFLSQSFCVGRPARGHWRISFVLLLVFSCCNKCGYSFASICCVRLQPRLGRANAHATKDSTSVAEQKRFLMNKRTSCLNCLVSRSHSRRSASKQDGRSLYLVLQDKLVPRVDLQCKSIDDDDDDRLNTR
jgi:hypothetical protein